MDFANVNATVAAGTTMEDQFRQMLKQHQLGGSKLPDVSSVTAPHCPPLQNAIGSAQLRPPMLSGGVGGGDTPGIISKISVVHTILKYLKWVTMVAVIITIVVVIYLISKRYLCLYLIV